MILLTLYFTIGFILTLAGWLTYITIEAFKQENLPLPFTAYEALGFTLFGITIWPIVMIAILISFLKDPESV